jgi:polyisoprenoid-binding protein YceI
MKNIILALFILPFVASGQKLISEVSNIKFYSAAPIENIEAVNETANSVIDLNTLNIVFAIKIKDFQFDKKLMQEHFNENYLDSDKYPKSIFKGKIVGWDKTEGKKEVEAIGELSLHGITKPVTFIGTIDKSGDKLEINSVFKVMLVDYKIKIPKAVFYNIAEEIEVTVKFNYKPYGN